jgi:poly(A) polymerase
MSEPHKQAQALCKTILRNGFDAYVINARLQEALLEEGGPVAMDIATDLSLDELIKLFPETRVAQEEYVIGVLDHEGVRYFFYPADVVDGSHPEVTVARVTQRMMGSPELAVHLACPYVPRQADPYEGFEDLGTGMVRFSGLPDETLKRDYLRVFRAMRFAANFHLPIEPNTWLTIVRAGQRALDYVPVTDIMDEFRLVEAENLHHFVRMLFDAQILHGLMPEVAALSRVRQVRNDGGDEENILEHTIQVMSRYPEELPFDWFGTMACLFHDVGKLYTAEYFGGEWSYYHHHHVGAKVTRKILGRLAFEPGDTDLICHLVRHHMRFHFMLTDKGVRRFQALDEYPRLIEMVRADIKARNGSYAAFNSNLKNLERVAVSGEMMEPLLNGNEIMDFTGLKPGPAVGIIRNALQQAQIAGDVTSVPEAVEFVCRYKDREKLA